MFARKPNLFFDKVFKDRHKMENVIATTGFSIPSSDGTSGNTKFVAKLISLEDGGSSTFRICSSSDIPIADLNTNSVNYRNLSKNKLKKLLSGNVRSFVSSSDSD